MLTTIKKSFLTWQKIGFQDYTTHVTRKLIAKLHTGESFRILLLELSQPKPISIQSNQRHHEADFFRFATADDLHKLHKDPKSYILARDLSSFERGSRCLLHIRGDALIGYTWISTAPLIELGWGMHFNMPDDMVYNFNSFTFPAYRGGSSQALRHLALMKAIKKEGKNRLFAYIDQMNYRSLRGVRKSGYKVIGTLTGIRDRESLKFSLKVQNQAWATQVRAGPIQHDS